MNRPPCFCTPPTPWAERRDDGEMKLDGQVFALRTCERCGATKSRRVPETDEPCPDTERAPS